MEKSTSKPENTDKPDSESRPFFETSIVIIAIALVLSPAFAVPPRGEDPVLLLGASLPDYDGDDIERLALFRWDPGVPGFVPVPFQIDEKLVRVFNPGTELEISELMYDVGRMEDGTLDANDELAFMLKDTGPRAPMEAEGPPGSDGTRYEIAVNDPAPAFSSEPTWVYLFRGDGLELASLGYMEWEAERPSSAIVTPRFTMDFQDRWLLTGYSVSPSCGTGTDLIDRYKGRGGAQPHVAETEDFWNPISFYLGGLLGPVRAIRYVRGAASGFNTIHHDVVYPAFWERQINLRIHDIADIYLYMDLRPATGSRFFSSHVPSGVDVDGRPDSSVGTALPTWSIAHGPDGGMAQVYDVPPSPFVGAVLFYYRDDEDYNDISQLFPNSDEDDSAFGNFGVHLDGVSSDETDTIPGRIRVVPLCSGEGDATVGALLRQRYDHPPSASAEFQITGLQPVRSLTATIVNADVVLDWQEIAGALSYRIYTSVDPSVAPESWILQEEVSTSSWTDPAILFDPDPRYYSIVPVGIAGEGPR